MKYYKVMIDYVNYIPIDETELEKALSAFLQGKGAIFSEGATKRIDAVLPDFNRIMGWNPGYKPSPEEYGEIARDKNCISARHLLGEVKTNLQIGTPGNRPLLAA